MKSYSYKDLCAARAAGRTLDDLIAECEFLQRDRKPCGARYTYGQRREAQANGISARTLGRRLADGWAVQRAITEKPGSRFTTVAECPSGGRCLSTPEQRELAATNGVSQRLLYSRLTRGWPVERAITTPPQPVGRPRRYKKRRQLWPSEYGSKEEALAAFRGD